MKSRPARFLVPMLLALFTAALYLPRLQDTPIHPERDEMYISLTAHSVAASGRDPSGLFMPVYFPIGPLERPLMWFQPMLMYAIALVLRVLPFTERSIRLPMVGVGIIDVVLMYVVAKRLFDRELPAIVAAVLLALTPAHFMFSRLALDYQAPLPFILGWLYCVLTYCRRGQPRHLFAAGLLLGFGLYTYIAADVLMPLYALLTCIVLYTRRTPAAGGYAFLAAGFVLPAMIGGLFLLRHPTIIRDVMLRYEPGQAHVVPTLSTVQTFIQSRHLDDAMSVYWTFWNPQLLFINGRTMLTGTAGVFLLAVAGALVVGVVRALFHFNAVSVLLLGGLFIAPIPASFVNEPEAVRRTLEVLPFVVLLAVYGLDFVGSATSVRAGRLAFLAMWSAVIYLVAAYRDSLPLAQAFIRASTVPVALIGLATLFRGLAIDRLPAWRVTLMALVSLGIIQITCFAVGYDVVLIATLALMAAVAVATALGGVPVVERTVAGQVATMALVASAFVYFYVGYSFIHRIGAIPASAQLLVIRFVCAAAILIALLGLARVPRRLVVSSRAQLLVVASLTLVAIQLAYFYIDYFRDDRARYLQVSAVALGLTGLALLLRGVAVARLRLVQLAAVAILGLAAIQFTYFYTDYFAGYRVRRSREMEGNMSVAYETLLERGRGVSIPAVYLSHKVEGAWLRDLYWKFYLLKYDRQDLLSRTSNAEAADGLDVGRIRQLPAGALVVASASGDNSTTIDQLVSSGELKRDTLVSAADGTPIFWILERINQTVR